MAGKGKRKPTKNQPEPKGPDIHDTVAEKPARAAPHTDKAERPEEDGPPVTGIGASAGGLDALKKLFAVMPADSGCAFVLIPHLDPNHESLMPELISRQTRMPVVEATEGMKVAANYIYIIPPNKYMTISGRVLRLTGPVERHGLQTSIDLFLRSLAEDLKEKAICIILSGTGSHGSTGLKAVKAAGGMAMVQDPQTAQYDRMPHNAVATGLADYVIAVEQMPALIDYIKHYFVLSDRTLAGVPDHLHQVLALLRARTKFDFRCYRKKMVSRRIERRMSLNHTTKIDDYLTVLRNHADEVKKLSRDLLISVTSFFRDAEAFQALETEVIAPLVAAKGPDATVRVWCAGCATGEEPYSVGMLLLEQLAKAEKNCPVHIFATDVDEDALEIARQAVYPESISADVSTERLASFFVRPGDSVYQVGKQLREIVVFARQNLITDPPFSQLDLIVCRNLLIYLEPEIQKKVIALLHFALREGGYLFLGPSETVGRHIDSFAAIDKKWRIYRRSGPARPGRAEFPITLASGAPAPPPRPTPPAGVRPVSLADVTQRLLLEAFAPAAVLITRKCEILYYFGPTDRYLRVASGEPTHDLLRLARDRLRAQLRAAIQTALQDNEAVTVHNAHVKRNGANYPITVVVRPVRDPKAGEGLLLVTFEEADQTALPAKPAAAGDDTLFHQLEFELKAAKEDLQSTVEEAESSNEELKAANEEVMSMNEELQSANEELETSKEELQSLNEELNTVNSQLQEKIQDLEAANNDLDNLLRCTDIPTIFVDTELHIKRFTPATTRLFNLIAGDIGRPLRDIARKFKDPQVFTDVEEVIRQLKPHEKEIHAEDDGWWLRRVTPYRTADNHIEGAVLTFNEVTQVKHADEQARRLATVLKSSNDAILIHDFAGQITAWNRGAEQLYDYSEAEALRMNIDTLIPEGLRLDTKAVWERLRRGERVEPWEARRVTKNGKVLDVLVTATALLDDAGQPIAIAKTDRNITEAKKSHAQLEQAVAHRTAALREREQRLQAIMDNALAAVLTVDANGLIRSVNTAGETMFGYSGAEIMGRSLQVLLAARHHHMLTDYLARPQDAAAATEDSALEVQGRRHDGSLFDLALSINHSKHLDLAVVIILDITRRKQLEHEVVEISALEQQRIGQDLHDRCGQELTALGLLTDRLCADLEEKWPAARELAVKVAQGIRRVLFQVRGISRGLARAEVMPADLPEALEELTGRLNESKTMRCRLRGGNIPFLGTTVQATHLFHIAQEACTNALKHSGAQKIEVQLESTPDAFILRIQDDGSGVAADARAGLGQQIMRNRASVIGATLTIELGADRGTVVTCTLKNFGRSNSDL